MSDYITTPQIWFVTQGASFKPDEGMKFLWGPKFGKDDRPRFYWENVNKINKGDFIFHYANLAIEGISIALSNGYESGDPNGNAKWVTNGYRADVQFISFGSPISLSKIIDFKSEFRKRLQTIKNKPFTLAGEVNSGYLYEFTPEAGKLIREIYGKPFGNKQIDAFFDQIATEEMESPLSLPDILPTIRHCHSYITAKGFRYQYEEIANFYLALRTKPFVILAGISGTGKTQLPRKFAEALGFSKEQVMQLAVRPDWTDSSDLLGYTALDGNFVPKDLTIAIQRARKNSNKPFFFILDEMNLARVEHYFSDFLSVIETRERVGNEIQTDAILREEAFNTARNRNDFEAYGWPQNLYLIGTVNMDETTHAFSRKVLDRANSIEMNDVDLNWIEPAKTAPAPVSGIPNAFLETPYLTSAELSETDKQNLHYGMDLLQRVNQILQKADLHFAYRVRDEIAFYLTLNQQHELMDIITALDFQLVQKILPRIHGSSERILAVLIDLLNLLENINLKSENFEFSQVKKQLSDERRYPRASAKIEFMLQRFDEDRFTSFWL